VRDAATDEEKIVDFERPRFVAAADVEVRPVEWLWSEYIPLGKMTVIEGDPNLAKSTVCIDISARVTRGAKMPDGSPATKGSVVFISYEDDAADTIIPRFKAAGGDPNRFFLLQSIFGPEGPRPVTIPDDVEHIEDVVHQVDAQLIVVDPLPAAFGSEVKTGIDHLVRRALTPVRDLAERRRLAVVLVRHWNKQASVTNLLYRGGGSIGIIGAARAGFAVAPDPEDPTQRVLIPVKTNLAPESARRALRYRVVTDEQHNTAAIEWLGTLDPAELAEAVQGGGTTDAGAIPEAVAILRELLEEGEVLATEAKRYAKEAGISDRTLTRARKRLGVKARPRVKDGRKRWYWSLPNTGGHCAR
jgi:hypothetical protein